MEIESGVKSGDKRPVEEEEEGEGGGCVTKKVKREGLVTDMRKVAEMVLVLAAMGKMRGGRVPSEAEKEIMSTARTKLAEVCQCFAPKDVFPRDVFGGIIEDLGLNKVKEQRLGFRPPKISIAEKLMFSKRKMEKSEELSQPSTTIPSQRLYANAAAAVESRGPSSAVRGFPSDKPVHTPASSGSFQPNSPFIHAASTNSTALPYQLPTSEVRPVVSGGLPANHLVKDSTSIALPKSDRPQFRLDGRPNGSYTSQVPATSSGDHMIGKTPTWSAQPQSVSSARTASETKVPTQTAFKVDGAVDARPGMAPHVSSSKPFITQSTTVNPQSVHQHSQGVNTVQAPLVRNSHFDVGKLVQKFIQPQNAERPVWTPPSRDYMNKALTCQVCKLTATDVDSVLVCDACEKGFHLKCLQINYPKGAPRSEWHCGKCLQLSNGKALPPKYGRVMRNVNASKTPSSTNSIQSSLVKKAGSFDGKVNQQKIKANGNTSLHSAAIASAVNKYSDQASVSKLANASEMRGNAYTIAGTGKIDDKASSGTSSNEITETSVPGISPSGLSVKRVSEEKLSDAKPYPPHPEAVQGVSVHSQSLANRAGNHQSGLSNDVVLSKQSLDNHAESNNLKESCTGESLRNKTQESCGDDQVTVRGNPAEASTTSAGHAELQRSLPHQVHSVDWVGDMLRVDEDKIFFHTLRINGVIYKLQEHVLVRFNKDRLIPSKVQAMWEDRVKKTKWVTVNRFYFPGDLPEAVGRPCGLETCEVYESIYGCNVMAGLIEGPCEVLPPSLFAVEKERRASSGTGSNANLRPLFLRKWIYDESKGLFRDASC